MRQDILNQLDANLEWLAKHFGDETGGAGKWATVQARVALDLYRIGDFEAAANALSVCTAQVICLLISEMGMNDRRAM